MAGESGFEGNMRAVIESYKQAQSPMARWGATCLEEVYLREDFASARLKGPMQADLKYAPLGIRVIGLLNTGVYGLSMNLFPGGNRQEDIRFGQRLRDEVAQLPDALGIVGFTLLDAIKNETQARGRQVLAALELGKAGNTDVVSVLYPKTHMDSIQAIMLTTFGKPSSDQELRAMGHGVAVGFLQSVPFTAGHPVLFEAENQP